MKILHFFLFLAISASCVGQFDYQHILSKKVLVLDNDNILSLRSIYPNKHIGHIDSISVIGKAQLNTETNFTILYLSSGKVLQLQGTYAQDIDTMFCVREDPCCGGLDVKYKWYIYIGDKDTILNIGTIRHYLPMSLDTMSLIWLPYPQKRCATHEYTMRHLPYINDTEEDYDLLMIGNAIYTIKKKNVFYILGTLDIDNQKWGLVATKDRYAEGQKFSYVLGWIVL